MVIYWFTKRNHHSTNFFW